MHNPLLYYEDAAGRTFARPHFARLRHGGALVVRKV
jgi:hypothetical protein